MENTTDSILMRVLIVAFDVSSEKLDYCYLQGGSVIAKSCLNDSISIREALSGLQAWSQENSFHEIRVICESTGVYHRNLLQIARQLGMRTNLVSGEAVSAQRKVKFNDTGKNDTRDAEVILDVGRVGRLLKHRQLQCQFDQLREFHRLVLRYEKKRQAARNELHAELRLLWPDLRIHKDVLFGPTGNALMQAFGANPNKINDAGKDKFFRQIKQGSKYTKRATLEKLWKQAVGSASQQEATELLSIREAYAQELYAEIKLLTEKTTHIEAQMIGLYQELQSASSVLPAARKGVVTWRMLSRLIAEIGPLDDFQSWRQLFRYAGLNLLERQSGKYKGQVKLSRRGRSAIRWILNRISLSLVQRDRLFAAYYRKKKERMPGDKAMTCVMRKFLKMLYGWSHCGQAFNERRVFHQHPTVEATAA